MRLITKDSRHLGIMHAASAGVGGGAEGGGREFKRRLDYHDYQQYWPRLRGGERLDCS